MVNIKKLFKSERGTHTEMRTVKRGGKTFKRKTRVGTKEITYTPTKTYKEFIITNKSLIDIEVNEIKKLTKDIKDEKNKNKFFKEEMRDLSIKLTDIWSKSKKDKIKEIPTKEEFYSKEYWYDPKRGKHPASGSGRLPSKEFAQIEITHIGGEPAIRIYNPWTKEEIVYYDLDQMDEAKERFKNLYDETFGDSKNIVKEGDNKKLISQYLAGMEYSARHLKKIEIIDVMKLMRGTGKTKVPVHRESGVKLEYRRTGKKESPRKGTGKMDKYPEAIKKEILDQRSYGASGVKIKNIIEEMIDHGLHTDLKTEKKLDIIKIKYNKLHGERIAETDPIKIKELNEKMKTVHNEERRIVHAGKSEISTHVNGNPTGRNFVKEGLITSEGKLTVTSQALTDWAKKQGVESIKKRTSAVEAEKSAHADTKKDLKNADKKIARLEIAASHNLKEIKLVQESKQSSDRLRQELNQDNKTLKDKLKACLNKIK